VRTRTRWPAHRITTAHLQAAYPFMAEGGLGSRGVYIGRDLYGGAFCFDVWELYAQGIHGPNMLVFGQIGYAKSSLVKTFVWRQMLFGKTAWIIDPKGEYENLAHMCGVEPIRFVSGGSLRLNPLDPAIGEDAQLVLLRSISEVMLGRPLAPEEDAALERAHREISMEATLRGGQATVPQVVTRLLEPSLDSADELRTTRERLAEGGRQLALALRRMGAGDLRGMFDGPTSPGLDLSGRLVVFNLREVKDAARPILMACTAAWLQGAWARNDGTHRIVVLDEAWVILRHLAIARWLRESWKLARMYGVQCVAVMHRLSDLTAAGDEGSEQVQLAKGLLEDSETRVIYRQSFGEVERARELLGLTQIEVEQIPNLQRGEALWRVASRSFIVQHRLSPLFERELVDTDANMAVRAPGAMLAGADAEPLELPESRQVADPQLDPQPAEQPRTAWSAVPPRDRPADPYDVGEARPAGRPQGAWTPGPAGQPGDHYAAAWPPGAADPAADPPGDDGYTTLDPRTAWPPGPPDRREGSSTAWSPGPPETGPGDPYPSWDPGPPEAGPGDPYPSWDPEPPETGPGR